MTTVEQTQFQTRFKQCKLLGISQEIDYDEKQ